LRIAEILQTDGRTDIKCLSNGRKNLITLKDQTKKAAIYLYQSLHLSEVSAQESVNKSFVRVRLYYFIYQWMSVQYIFFSYEIAEFRIQELFEPLFKEK
jgi:hypothetical protein